MIFIYLFINSIIIYSSIESDIKHTLGWPCSLIFLIAERTVLVLDILKLILIQCEELPTFLARLEKELRYKILVIPHSGCGVQFPQILHIH